MSIPMLPAEPTREQVREYLRWLAASEFAYHLDDDPTDCGFPDDVAAALESNADLMFDRFPSDELWAFYWPLCSAGEEPLSDHNGRA